MSDTRRMLAEMADPLFAELGPDASEDRDLARFEELDLPLLLASEADGGFGGDWIDALTVFRLAGYHALGIDLPALVVERAAGIDRDLAMAFARACQIAGALDAALALSVTYVNERQQFGRPLAKFQAVQQSLATFACEAAAANCAAMGAAQALALVAFGLGFGLSRGLGLVGHGPTTATGGGSLPRKSGGGGHAEGEGEKSIRRGRWERKERPNREVGPSSL